MKSRNRQLTPYSIVTMVLCGLIAALNVAACFRGFCNWYKSAVYPLISEVGGRLTGWFPVAMGEMMIYLGVLLFVLGILSGVLRIFLRRRKGYCRYFNRYIKTIFMIIWGMLLIYTLNWVIPFRSDLLTISGAVERSYTLEELENVRNHIVNELNACALQADRDESGTLIYSEDVDRAVYEAMENQKGEYPLLKGYYPRAKMAGFSDILDWMDIGGYTYPYTMEITINKYVMDLYYPALLAHEMAHHKGFYQENEANFISFLACVNSSDSLVRYSGYRDIYYYVNNAYLDTLMNAMDRDAAFERYKKQPQKSSQIRKDEEQAWEVSRERYEQDSHPAEELQSVAVEVADTGWSVQGDILQENSYDGVVKMVLEYYDVQQGGLKNGF